MHRSCCGKTLTSKSKGYPIKKTNLVEQYLERFKTKNRRKEWKIIKILKYRSASFLNSCKIRKYRWSLSLSLSLTFSILVCSYLLSSPSLILQFCCCWYYHLLLHIQSKLILLCFCVCRKQRKSYHYFCMSWWEYNVVDAIAVVFLYFFLS